MNKREMIILDIDAKKNQIQDQIKADFKAIAPMIKQKMAERDHILSKEKLSEWDAKKLTEIDNTLGALKQLMENYEVNLKWLMMVIDDLMLSKKVIIDGANYRLKFSELLEYNTDLQKRISQLEEIAGIC